MTVCKIRGRCPNYEGKIYQEDWNTEKKIDKYLGMVNQIKATSGSIINRQDHTAEHGSRKEDKDETKT